MAKVLHSECKGGKIFVDEQRKKVFFERKNLSVEYELQYLDFLIEWGQLDLRPTPEVNAIVETFKGLYHHSFPARCEFRDGRSSDYCLLDFTTIPPSNAMFERETFSPKWYYLNQVSSFSPSPKALTPELVRALKKLDKAAQRNMRKIESIKGNLLDHPGYPSMLETAVLVVRNAKGQCYKFSASEMFVYDRYQDAADLSIVESPTETQLQNAIELSVYDYNERSDPRDYRGIVTIYVDAV